VEEQEGTGAVFVFTLPSAGSYAEIEKHRGGLVRQQKGMGDAV
jgi:hypothetical protein